MTAAEKIAQAARANPGANPKALARRIVASLSRAEIVQLVANAIEDEQRRLVKIVEEDVLDALFSKSAPAPKIVVSADDPIRMLFGHKLAFGQGVSVFAEHMTLDQWNARRAMLLAQRHGIGRAIEICDAAIARIQGSGAACLADIGIGRAA